MKWWHIVLILVVIYIGYRLYTGQSLIPDFSGAASAPAQ